MEHRNALRDVIRVLLLVQAAILLASTIEAFVFSGFFAGGSRLTVVLSGAAALTVLFARSRLDGSLRRRLLYMVEGFIVATFGLDMLLALLMTHASPPLVAILTAFALPLAIVALLRRSPAIALKRAS
ncbi:MAG TPA: hypothetical protein VJQ09_03320 [Candidatus Limnocylindria bacterium]|nr:hypothetical protein [Candidatus Limnocylindria bacterium]